MKWYSVFLFIIAVGSQLACAPPEPIVMRHPVNLKTVQCVDQQCALQYEAAGYLRLTEAEKTKAGSR